MYDASVEIGHTLCATSDDVVVAVDTRLVSGVPQHADAVCDVYCEDGNE